jgi:hypothetical protein
VDTSLDRPRWRFTGNLRVARTLQVGAEFNPAVSEVNPLVTWFVLTEGERRPAAFLGTSSDRIGSPEGTQSYYVTIAKYVPVLRASPYASVNYSEWDAGWNLPFGANIELPHGGSLRPMYDGQRTHLLATYTAERWSATLIWAWLESAGVSVSFGF